MSGIKWPKHSKVKENVPLARHTSWLVGGPAQYFSEPETAEQLQDLYTTAIRQNLNITVLGGGTNVLISDAGLRGLVISYSKYSGIEDVSDSENLKVWALAGTNKSELLKLMLKAKLAPALFLAGLPGQIGGGVVMNAGVSEALTPREFCEIVSKVEVLRPDGSLEVFENSQLRWNYRHCDGWKPGIITRVQIQWPLQSDPTILDQVRKLNQTRLQKQPLEWPSCGSIFRNPKPLHAGKLIEDCGLKGHSIGGAQVSEKHANFIVNKGGAKASDIHQLIELCVQRVKEKFQVELQSEVVLLGRP